MPHISVKAFKDPYLKGPMPQTSSTLQLPSNGFVAQPNQGQRIVIKGNRRAYSSSVLMCMVYSSSVLMCMWSFKLNEHVSRGSFSFQGVPMEPTWTLVAPHRGS